MSQTNPACNIPAASGRFMKSPQGINTFGVVLVLTFGTRNLQEFRSSSIATWHKFVSVFSDLHILFFFLYSCVKSRAKLCQDQHISDAKALVTHQRKNFSQKSVNIKHTLVEEKTSDFCTNEKQYNDNCRSLSQTSILTEQRWFGSSGNSNCESLTSTGMWKFWAGTWTFVTWSPRPKNQLKNGVLQYYLHNSNFFQPWVLRDFQAFSVFGDCLELCKRHCARPPPQNSAELDLEPLDASFVWLWIWN